MAIKISNKHIIKAKNFVMKIFKLKTNLDNFNIELHASFVWLFLRPFAAKFKLKYSIINTINIR